MTIPRNNSRKKKAAVSAVLGMIIGLGITAAVGGGVYFTFQEQADLFSSSSQVEVKNLNAVRTGDNTIKITANVKNVGSAAIGKIAVQEISTGGDFTVTLTPDTSRSPPVDQYSFTCALCLPAQNNPGTARTGDATSNAWTTTSFTVANPDNYKITSIGFNPVDGGSSTALRVTIERVENSSGTIDLPSIKKVAQISERLTFQLFYTSGQDEFVSDVYNTRIRPG